MQNKHRSRWLEEIKKYGKSLKTPQDLLMRRPNAEDFADTAVIGGISLADVIAGKVAEWQIPNSVLEAYHAQYPGLPDSFVEEIQHLSGHPEQLMGIINGVKGKLFEIDYADWLNSGHLPHGYIAELAHSPTNPAWDISIHDANGHVDELLQMKASTSIAYIHSALAAHPEIDVVVPHEMYETLSQHSELLPHIIDSHQDLGHLTSHVTSAVSHADAAGIHYHAPVFAFAFVVGQNYMRYRRGEVGLKSALQNVSERALLASVASLASWAVATLSGISLIGIPVGMGTRLVGGQMLHNRDQRKVIDAHMVIIRSSRLTLETRFAKHSS
jgi:hypothetical protein